MEPTVVFFTAPVRPPLATFVERIWAVNGIGEYNREVILPNGAIELMVNFGPPQRVVALGDRADGTLYTQGWVAGLQNQPLTVEALAVTDVLGIRFRPGAAHAFLPGTIEALTNQVIHGDLILGPAIASLRARLAEAPTRALQVRAAETWLFEQFAPQEHAYRIVQRALCALQQTPFGAPIGTLCDDLGLSHKHLITLFRRLVGVPPKTMARILRFHAVLNQVRQRQRINWSRVAHDFHYCDQAHFIHEFQRFSGITPGQYPARRSPDGGTLIGG